MNAYQWDRYYGDCLTQKDRFTDREEPVIDLLERKGISFIRSGFERSIMAFLSDDEDALPVDVTNIESMGELEDLIDEVTT